MEKVRTGIIGHTGRAGGELLRILSKHPKAEIVYKSSPSGGEKGSSDKADVLFFCTPDEISRKEVPKFLKRGKRIIDFSRVYRTEMGATYGLPEITDRKRIRNSNLIANPGCYPTAALIPLYPIRKFMQKIRISADSGISGTGKKPTGTDSIRAYNIGDTHEHLREMKHQLKTEDVLFIPHILDFDRGIFLTAWAEIETQTPPWLIGEMYERYKNEPFIKIMSPEKIELRNVLQTNMCHFGIKQIKNELIIISAIDNLIKGAAGQAVQNMNIMFGFDEELGLS